MLAVGISFIKAERSRDYNEHFKCVERTIRYFQASGHFNYAKSANLYLLDMLRVERCNARVSVRPIHYQVILQLIRCSEKFLVTISNEMEIFCCLYCTSEQHVFEKF